MAKIATGKLQRGTADGITHRIHRLLMSAIAGIWDRGARLSNRTPSDIADLMAAAMAARGPDRQGHWHEGAAGLALAYRGLAVDDCVAPATAPLVSSCGRFVLACDGEIYNSEELIAALEAAGRAVAKASDMAAVVEGAAIWGIGAVLRRLNGSFAGALWDRERKTLHLFRDRFGVRPLYYAQCNGLFLFASELKGLRACPDFHAELDRDALVGYLRWRSISNPQTIYRGARMLQPGACLRLGPEGVVEIATFWALHEAVLTGRNNAFAGSDKEALDDLDALLRRAVSQRLGKVPVGIHLSGGLDSSLLLALARDIAAKPPIGLTIGYREAPYDESHYAEIAAKHVNAVQHTLYVTPQMARDAIPRLPEVYDEPNGDISQIPGYLLAQMTRRHVAVAFTGEGAAEPLCSIIPFYAAVERYVHLQRVPLSLRHIARAGVESMPPFLWAAIGAALPGRFRSPRLDDKLLKLAPVLTGNANEMYRAYRSYWPEPGDMVVGGREQPGLLEDPQLAELIPDLVQRWHYFFTLTTATDSVMGKAERGAAAAGLQIRMPYLQPEYVDFGWSMPLRFKRRGGRPKWLLRELARRYFPDSLVDRKRGGFDLPLAIWLRGPLRDWAEALLDERRLRSEGVFEPREIRAKWLRHLSGERDHAPLLWLILTFQAWKERWLP